MVKYSFNLLCLELGSYLISEGKFAMTGNPFEATKFHLVDSDYSKQTLSAAKTNGFPEAKFVKINVSYTVEEI